ncbi:hypothetical protein JDV02_007557 [Purpureocillium takamizusanense]|uniref:Endo-1,3(4)-beta-glucanase n=1 Tax=Purpureocillium takamizusanense TaxID=2060973 RepID=A0A9Q8QLY3_9HYPO|nr:uncharacterized protein JDV02_007557 [Purpureocillium takamizusanense]UNI21581.1 hypothetical protein JDV02_007557 [Purpureocillium takamizusanense]
MAYALSNSFVGESLLSSFNWFDGKDPSNGFVSYQSRANAEALGLFSVDETTGVVRLGVDSSRTYGQDQGRPSIRLESKQSFDDGLFIADFLHMPPSQCGLWPAFWTYGTDWPAGGEVDIIEGVNTAHQNIISAHTADGCKQSSSLQRMYSGSQRNEDCAVGSQNIGCGFTPSGNSSSSYGDGFNAAGGGVYAMEWDNQHIKVWHFTRNEIPDDIGRKRPSPSSWRLPDAVFGGSSCEVDKFFKQMSVVININFCGDYGNAAWGKSDQCNNFAQTCTEYVANNPKAFANAYWDVRYIDTYQKSGRDRPEPTTTITPVIASPTTAPGGFPAPGLPSSIVAGGVTIPAVPPGHVNRAKVGNFAYLGCFGSSAGFPTFVKADESPAMTLARCTSACAGKTLAGVYQSACYCAEALDAETRAVSPSEKRGGVCDHVCPGDQAEFCGGNVRGNNKKNDTGAAPVRRGRPLPRAVPDSRNLLLTVYGVVESNALPPMAPPMAPASPTITYTAVVTATEMRTVYPLRAMHTKVVHAAGCGCDDDDDDDEVPPTPTRTVTPLANTLVVRPSASCNGSSTTTRTSGDHPPVVTAGASALRDRATALVAAAAATTTMMMLALALLL